MKTPRIKAAWKARRLAVARWNRTRTAASWDAMVIAALKLKRLGEVVQ